MNNTNVKLLFDDVTKLLIKLIETPSMSKEEQKTAVVLADFLTTKNINFNQIENNIWAKNKNFNINLPTILLNSHHDTVKPNNAYTNDPYKAVESKGKLYGLGSNDAGGPLVALLAVFLYFYERADLKYNLIWAASAEEEISGKNGIELLLKQLPKIEFAIVGEPTFMQMAIAEKGLMVLDCKATGIAGHAARNEGVNAIYLAIEDINWFKNFEFQKTSETLGPIKMTVAQIQAGTQHNVVPHECIFVVDVRTTDAYTQEETLDIIKSNVKCEVNARSTRLRPSGIEIGHPIVEAGLKMGMKTYGSPTLSDQALMPFTSIKIGPGDSARSHTADEFIYLSEIKDGIDIYIKLLENII
jgi:acetylornithine deacetylase